ncbi:histone deacetylase complex subunit SAP18, putative [Plasmodium vivax]|uniref:Histone deacetylase complex subunit SAP18, putative n=1 Tax=Plasmodium vivax TaxID=5855 RepID=A0A1G4H6E3_PLAVI|nr:histone deacetylase complex subunit SAP18, putative [Plasmodium vivax]
MSSSEKSPLLQNDQGNNTQSADGKEKLEEKVGSSDADSGVKFATRSDFTNEMRSEGRSEGRSERGEERGEERGGERGGELDGKGKPREANKRRPKKDASEESYGSSMSLLSLSDVGRAGEVKRRSEKKTHKRGSSHKVRRHKDRGEKRRHSSSDGSSDSSDRSDSSGESLSSHHSRDGKDRKRKGVTKDVKKGKHKAGAAVGGGYSKLSSFSLSSSDTDDDLELESISDLNYKPHSGRRQKKLQKKVKSDRLSSKKHHHRYDEEEEQQQQREGRKGSAKYTKKKNGSTRGESREVSYSVSLSSEEESKKRKKKKKKLAADRSGRRPKRGSSEEHTYTHNSRGNVGESEAEEHHNHRHNHHRNHHRNHHHDDDGRSPLGKKHPQKGTAKGHANALEGDPKRGGEKRRAEKKKNKIKKTNKASKANRNGRGSDADEYESTTESSSAEMNSRSSPLPSRKKRRASFSEAQSADLAVSVSSEERFRAKGRMPHDGTVMVRDKRERTGGRKAPGGIHQNFDEDDEVDDDDDAFLHPRMKRGDPYREGRPKRAEEEEVPRFRDREWQPYGGTHHREFEKERKEHAGGGSHVERGHMERGHMQYCQMESSLMAPPYRHRNHGSMEHKKDVAILIKNRRHEYLPEHGDHCFDEVRSPGGLIDREKTCPFLLRLFYKLDDEYSNVEDVKLCKKSGVQSNELQIYGWLDITMREIVTLVKDFYQESRKRDAHWVFKVYSNERKELTFLSRVHSTKHNYREDNKTLLSLDYEIGDILLLSIMFERCEAV